jgi:hypothetical protein
VRDARAAGGVGASGVTGYTLMGNVADSNGGLPSCFPGAGIGVAGGSTSNVVSRNDASNNRALDLRPGVRLR